MSPADRALCEHAVLLTHNQHDNSPAHLDTLRSHGFDDRAIHDATQVIGYFNYITRIADGLGIDMEDFVDQWDRPLISSSDAKRSNRDRPNTA